MTIQKTEQVLDEFGSWIWRASGRPEKNLILFVHGFRGNPLSTWRRFPDLVRIRGSALDEGYDIASIGYRTERVFGGHGLVALGEILASVLEVNSVGAERIYIVAHSLGGILARSALVACARDDRRDILSRTRQLHVIGVPYSGLWFLPNFVAQYLFFNKILSRLGHGSAELRRILLAYNDVVANACETPPLVTNYFGDRDWVASNGAATERLAKLCPRESIRLVPADHISIAKPHNPNDTLFRLVTRAIVGDAGTGVRVRTKPLQLIQHIKTQSTQAQGVDTSTQQRLQSISRDSMTLLLGLFSLNARTDTDPVSLDVVCLWGNLDEDAAAKAAEAVTELGLVSQVAEGLRMNSSIYEWFARETYRLDLSGVPVSHRVTSIQGRLHSGADG